MPEVQQMLSLHLNSQTHQLNKAHYVDLEPPKKKKKNIPSKQVQAKQRMQSPLKYKQQQHLHLQQTHCKKYYGKKLKPLIVLEFYLIRQNVIRSNGMYTNYTTTSNKSTPPEDVQLQIF
jgi:hypothetical protein